MRIDEAAVLAHGAVLAAEEREQEAVAQLESAHKALEHLVKGYAASGRKPPADDLADRQLAISEKGAALDRARKLHERAREVHQSSRRASSKNLDFLRVLRAGTLIVDAPAPHQPKNATVDSIWKQLRDNAGEAERVRLAPRDRAALHADIKAAVDALAAKGAPRVDRRIRSGDPARLKHMMRLDPGPGGHLIGDAGASFLVWVMRDEIVAKLQAMVPADSSNTLSNQQREKRLAELAEKRLELERIEEALIEQAEAEGRQVERREDADIRAILGIAVVERR